jgi:hypothetical protein
MYLQYSYNKIKLINVKFKWVYFSRGLEVLITVQLQWNKLETETTIKYTDTVVSRGVGNLMLSSLKVEKRLLDASLQHENWNCKAYETHEPRAHVPILFYHVIFSQARMHHWNMQIDKTSHTGGPKLLWYFLNLMSPQSLFWANNPGIDPILGKSSHNQKQKDDANQ